MSHHVGFLITAVVTGPPGAAFVLISYLFRVLLVGLSTGGAPPALIAMFNAMISGFLIGGIILIIVGLVFLGIGISAYRNRLNK